MTDNPRLSTSHRLAQLVLDCYRLPAMVSLSFPGEHGQSTNYGLRLSDTVTLSAWRC